MTDELPEPNDDRLEKLAARVESSMREGERFVIHMFEGQIHIEDATLSSLERRSPALFGRLLSINERLDTGCSLLGPPIVLAAVLAYALHAHLLESWLGVALSDKLASWWVDGLMLVISIGIGFGLSQLVERSRYHRAKPGLLAAMETDDADWDALIAELHRIPELANVYRLMKLDEPPRRGDRG